jgi:hypothetical protein
VTRRLRIRHFILDVLHFTGLRDRLRCPKCHAIGTWKPHGGWFDETDLRRVRRWLCKWCGHYVGPEGVRKAYVDTVRNEWTLFEDLTPGLHPWTPETARAEGPLPHTWPWRG